MASYKTHSSPNKEQQQGTTKSTSSHFAMDVWSWISNLPSSHNWPQSDPQLLFQLAKDDQNKSQKLILLKAERTAGPNTETLVTFSISLQGFYPSNPHKTLWVSNPCPLSIQKPFFLPLLLQLLEEIIARAPTAHGSTNPRTPTLKLDPEPVTRTLSSHAPETISSFGNLVFLCRLFWLCVYDAPAEAGSLYFQTLASNIDTLLSCTKQVMKTFLVSVGADGELYFMRTLGYTLAKLLILRELGGGLASLQSLPSPSSSLGFSYANESHGFWVLKGYAPVLALTRTCFNGQQDRYMLLQAKESVLRYALAHQQLEAVIQLQYSILYHENFIEVRANVDNLRVHVAKLGFGQSEDGYEDERHFPSRVRVWVGPELGAAYVGGLSLGRSSDNPEREVEMQRVVKGSLGNLKFSKVKATARSAARTRMRNWRWEQDAEGNAAIFDAVLCDNVSGVEVAAWKPDSGGNWREDPKSGFRKRYTGACRAFNKTGGLVFAGDDYGKGVSWRLSREMEGKVLKWRIGGKVWLSYLPNDVKSIYFDTRYVKWYEEVDLPLVARR